MLTGLPLRWSGGGDIAAMIAKGSSDDPALARLTSAGPVSLVDSLVDHVPPPGGTLLLAHPRALAPRELVRSEEHTSELQSLMRISYAVFCLKKKKQRNK